MAEDIVSKIIVKLGDAAFKECMFIMKQNSHIQWLKEIESIIEAELRKIDHFEASSNAVQGNKMKRLQCIHDDIVYFFDEQAARSKRQEIMGGNKIGAQLRVFFSSSNQLVSPFRTAKQIKSITRELGKFTTVYALPKSIVTDLSGNQNWCISSQETSPLLVTPVFVGRDTDTKNIVNMLCNSSNGHMSHSLVAIVGVGGQGKTTLAQHVCQDDRVKSSFDKQLWVSVSPKSNVNEILAKIITSATDKKPRGDGLEQLCQQVFQAIVGKKCLLVLDNVYYVDSLRDDSEQLNGILKRGDFWGNGGKVLITTRSNATAKFLGVRKPYELQDLAEDHSWTLLRGYAIKQEQEEKKEFDVEEIGKDIVKMCPKVPLVLRIIGCHLADKDYEWQWEHFRKELASNPNLYMQQQQEKIKQILKLCYDQLDYDLMRCAAFCSLFPKGHHYYKDKMINYWIALGFLQSRGGINLKDVGEACVLELTRRAFFEDSGFGFGFRMHDIMHDFMQLMGKEQHLMIDSKTEDILEGVRHVSVYIDDLNWEVLLSKISDKNRLKSILLVSSKWDYGLHGVQLGSRIDKLVRKCRMLRVLEVYRQEIKKVPTSIGELTFLRRLDLSGNPLSKVPNSITKLVNLLSLNLSGCRNLRKLPRKMANLVNLVSLYLSYCENLEELSKDIGKLLKLRHLCVYSCNLRYMPKGIGNLTKLQTLDVFVVGEKRKNSRGSKGKVKGAKLEELGRLNNLKGGLNIYVRGQSTDIVSEAREAHLEKKTELTQLEVEFEKRAEEDENFLEGLQPSGKKLMALTINNYGGKRLPKWITDARLHQRFPKLKGMCLFCSERKNPIRPTHTRTDWGYFEWPYFLKIKVDSREGDMLDQWIPGYSRLRKQLEMGSVEVELIPHGRRRKWVSGKYVYEYWVGGAGNGLIQKDFDDLAADQITSLVIERELVSRSSSGGQQQQVEVLLRSCFSNLYSLTLSDIPELEVVPEEFRDFSISRLEIEKCPKLKAIPDWIHTLSSLTYISIENAPEMKALPASVGSLTSLTCLFLWECSGLESLPHQIKNLPESCSLEITGCSKALYEKCEGEYWPHLQHLQSLEISSSEGDKFQR